MILIAGPCVIENYAVLKNTVEHILNTIKDDDIDFYFKSSFKKDNRTNHQSFNGIPEKEAINLIRKIKKEYNVKITTDFHTSQQVDKYGKYFDLIQIPAFLARQNELLKSAAKNGSVHIKKAQWMDAEDIIGPYSFVRDCKNIFFTDRGTLVGNHKLYMDARNAIKMRVTDDVKILVDITHPNKNCGLPNLINSSTILKSYLPFIDGVFLETHPDTKSALCDKETMLSFEEFDTIIKIMREYNDKH